MEKLYYRTFRQAQQVPTEGETNDLPSQTIQGEAESIAEMFKKFQNGVPIRTRQRNDSDYTLVDHDDPNFFALARQSDPLTAKDSIIIPKQKEHPVKVEPVKSADAEEGDQ